MRTVLVLALAAVVSACEPAAALSTDALPVDGAWRVAAHLDHHGCPELGDPLPVRPGEIALERGADGWTVFAAGAAAQAWTAIDVATWVRSAAGPWDGCWVEGEAVWAFDEIGPTSFAATHTATYTLSGRCAVQAQTCTVVHALYGVR